MVRVFQADAREVSRLLEPECVQAVVTSPPYYRRRDYGVPPTMWGGRADCAHAWEADSCARCGAWRGQLGLEPDPDRYVAHLVEVCREVRKVLRKDGIAWVNVGDGYVHDGPNRNGLYGGVDGSRRKLARHRMDPANLSPLRQPSASMGLPRKNLYLIPQRLALALQEDGWWVRQAIIFWRPNAMPDEHPDRPALDYEQVLMLTRSEKCYFNREAVWERGRGSSSVWEIPIQPVDVPHTAVMPERLAERCILLSTRPGDLVLDPFCGSGTTLRVAERHGREAVGIDLNPGYVALAERRRLGNQLAFGW